MTPFSITLIPPSSTTSPFSGSFSTFASSSSHRPMAIPVTNRPSTSVGDQEFFMPYLRSGWKTLPTIFLTGVIVVGRYGLISGWSSQSTKAGRRESTLKFGDSCWIWARASSASPLILPKMGVKRPGENVAPCPDM